jgi:acetyl-CoA carboxylase biotin carboxyl carrier protein
MTDSSHDSQPIEDEFGLSAVRELLRLIQGTDVTEIQIERGTSRLHVKRGANQPPPYLLAPSIAANPGMHAAPLPPVAPFHPVTHEGQSTPPPVTPDPGPTGQIVTAPMVGTFYASASPKDPAFVSEGDEVRTGEVVGIIEAMKIMNEIESEFAGRVIRVVVQNGQPVEFGQPLMIIEPL